MLSKALKSCCIAFLVGTGLSTGLGFSLAMSNCGMGGTGAGSTSSISGSGGASGGIQAVLVPLALLLFWVAKVAEEAFKPVRSTYLNCLVVDGSDRAFVLSMATPFGATIILVGIGLLAASQHFVESLNEVPFSVPLLFVILGTLGVVLTVKLSRRAARPPCRS